jgi:hypothetical protein
MFLDKILPILEKFTAFSGVKLPVRAHKLNPTTGKPYNTNFSRPYDLSRHEDTIHNIRKLKLKCTMCTEEKLFSRHDSVTRHLRVVHPEVEFPGKHRQIVLIVGIDPAKHCCSGVQL